MGTPAALTMKPNLRAPPAPWPRTITIGGLPGTGTTTASRRLGEMGGLQYVYAGQIFRAMAEKKGMTLEEFGAYAEDHPEIDRSLDDEQAQLLKGAALVLEGRLSGYLAVRQGVPAFKAWFTCDPYVRAERLVERDGGDLEKQMEATRRREASERKRYRDLYGFDMNDLGLYDLVLDTTRLTKDDVVQAVVVHYARSLRPRRWWRFGLR